MKLSSYLFSKLFDLVLEALLAWLQVETLVHLIWRGLSLKYVSWHMARKHKQNTSKPKTSKLLFSWTTVSRKEGHSVETFHKKYRFEVCETCEAITVQRRASAHTHTHTHRYAEQHHSTTAQRETVPDGRDRYCLGLRVRACAGATYEGNQHLFVIPQSGFPIKCSLQAFFRERSTGLGFRAADSLHLPQNKMAESCYLRVVKDKNWLP